MISKTTLQNSLVFLSFLIHSLSYAQTTTYATTKLSEDNVSFSNNSIDANLATKAEVRASSGLALGIGAYTGHLELEYPTPLAGNTTSYIKIDTEENLLSSLLGGSLGNLLSDITGVLLLGNQEFTIEAKNNTNTILQGDSHLFGTLATDNLRVVTDINNDYFLALAPNQPYDGVRITNRVGSLIGLNNTRDLGVYGAFHTQGNSTCGQPSYTSFSGSGLTVDLLNIGGAGVTNPHLALDGNPTTFSQMGLGVIGVAANIEQTIYFDTTADSDDSYYVSMAIDPALLELGIANSIEIIAQNGGDSPVFSTSLSSLLDVDALGLLQGNGMATIGFHPDAPADRITLRMSSLLNVALDQQIRIHDVFRAPGLPTIAAQSQNLNICNGAAADLIATAQSSGNVELRWYDAEVGGNLLATVNSGETFTTPALNASTTYYVASAEVSCAEESPRVAAAVNVVDMPTANDIDVLGNQNPICSSSDVVLVPSSSINGTYTWYFDANKTNPITDGMVTGAATYSINSNGVMTVEGLTEAGGPYTYYVAIADALASCENLAGDLKQVDVAVIDSSANVSINSVTEISLNNLLTIFNGSPAFNLKGSANGDVNAGDTVTLSINGNTYTGALAGDLTFDIAVDGIDLASDTDQVIEAFVGGVICTAADIVLVEIPELIIDTLTQVFCALDLPTVADIDVNSSNSVFFDSLTAGSQIDAATPLVNGGVYFAGLLNVPTSILTRVQVTIVIIDVPAPTTTTVDQIFCEGDDATVSDIQTNETDVIFFDSMIGGTILDPDQPLVDGEVYFAVRLSSGCESSERTVINVIIGENDPITLNGESEDVCQGRTYTYTTEAGKENYVWTIFGGSITEGGTDIDAFATVVWNDLQNTSISVAYEDDLSCEPNKILDLDVAVISCGMVLGEEFCLFVYNEFTPNNDGFNDFFKVECIETYSSVVKIYNRNGNLVFQAVDYQNNWDGIANVSGVLNSGQHLPSGAYYYVIEIPELERNFVGWLQMAR